MVREVVREDISTLEPQAVLDQICNKGSISIPLGMTLERLVDLGKGGLIPFETYTNDEWDPLYLPAVGGHVHLSPCTDQAYEKHEIKLVILSKGKRTRITYFIPLSGPVTDIDLYRASKTYLAKRMPLYKLFGSLAEAWLAIQKDTKPYGEKDPRALARLEVYQQELRLRFPGAKFGHVVEP